MVFLHIVGICLGIHLSLGLDTGLSYLKEMLIQGGRIIVHMYIQYMLYVNPVLF